MYDYYQDILYYIAINIGFIEFLFHQKYGNGVVFMSAYNLDNDEAVIMQTSGVSDGSIGNVDLILTNKNLS